MKITYKPYVYGSGPHPRTWHETAQILKQKAPRIKISGKFGTADNPIDSMQQLLKIKK
jgi:hypothetical protein